MQTQNSNLVRKILLSYAMTFMIISFADSLTMIVDGMVVSQGLGPTALAAYGLADPSYKIASLFTGVLSAGLQALCAQAMGSGDRKKTTAVFSLGLLVTVALSVILSVICFVCTGTLCRLFGIDGLLAAIPVSEAAVLIGYTSFLLLSKHKGDLWNRLLMIPDDFGYNSENSFSVSISTVEEAVAVSERIESFCKEHQVDERKSFFSARCMEELSTNIILNGFTGDDKKHHCDIRVMIDPDEVVLRLRDDCPYFNLRERYDALAEDDIDAGVWIRLVFALAKDVNYINIFNTNTLIIRM